MSGKLLECSFLIPSVQDGDRRPHKQVAWRMLHGSILPLFKGLSGPERSFLYRDSELVRGSYTEEATGRLVHDRSRRYTVAVPESEVETLRDFLRKVAKTFDQKCIYLSVAGIVEFVTPRPEDRPLE